MLRVLGRIFGKPRYSSMAFVVTLAFLVTALLLPNRSLLFSVLFSDSIAIGNKLTFALSLLGSISTNFSFWSASYLVLVSIMFGVNIALITYYIRRRQVKNSNRSIKIANIGGIVSAIFGIGCMACGSIVLTALFGVFGAGAVIAFLPLHGFEFGLVGISLLAFSIYYIAKKVDDPLICRVD